MKSHDYRRFVGAFDRLTPAQIEDAGTRLRDARRRREALAEIEARTEQERNCPFCAGDRRQRWGWTRTGVQRYRCDGCLRTWSGRTGSAIRGIHRPDLFLAAVRDMLGDRKPLSVRKLARRLGLDKHTVWRWRMLIQRALSGSSDTAFVGMVEADEAFQRESRKGSRERVRHFRDPQAWPAPPRRRWREYRHHGVLMMRGLSRWQMAILTLTDRSGARRLERFPDRRDRTICQSFGQVMAADAVLCSDGLSGYAAYARQQKNDHFVVGSKPGTRLASPTHHIQNTNALHARMRTFITPLRGPASRYLDGYLQWFIARERGVTSAVQPRKVERSLCGTADRFSASSNRQFMAASGSDSHVRDVGV